MSATEEKCGETYQRIRKRLGELRDLSASNLALRRLIKRNMKRERQIQQVLTDAGLAAASG